MNCTMRKCKFFGEKQNINLRLCCKSCEESKKKWFKKCKHKCDLSIKNDGCAFSYLDKEKND